MKVIFLDIDGVLNSNQFAKATKNKGMLGIDPKALALLHKIIQETQAVVVVSSSWRVTTTIPRLNYALRLDTTGATPTGGYSRGEEIQRWLKLAGESVSNFVILDDADDMGELSGNLIQTSFETGLTDVLADVAISRLNARRPNTCVGCRRELSSLYYQDAPCGGLLVDLCLTCHSEHFKDGKYDAEPDR